MKEKLLLIVFCVVSILAIGQQQSILDFEQSITGQNPVDFVINDDYIYVITKNYGDPNYGMFFKLSNDGAGFTTIHSFDDVTGAPSSLVKNDTCIFLTTRKGKFYRYTFENGNFSALSDLPINDSKLKYVSNTDIYGCNADYSGSTSFGTIFKMNHDGTNLDTIYEFKNIVNGTHPVDFVLKGSDIFVACYGGGLYPYTSDNGNTFNYSGCIVKLNIDGSGYTKIFDGRDSVGTQPESLLYYEGYFYGLFSDAGNDPNGKLFRFNEQGLDFKILADIGREGRGKLFIKNDTLYGITYTSLFLYDIKNHRYSKYIELTSEIGIDATVGPLFNNSSAYVCTQQGGKYSKGAILRIDTLNNYLNTIDYKIKVYDTTYVSVNDTVFIFDTTLVSINDTISVFDTTFVSVTDTLIIDVLFVNNDDQPFVNSIKVYPNPTNDKILIDYGEFSYFEDYRLKIYNSVGAEVYSDDIEQPIIEINLSEWGDKGLYFIELIENDIIVAVKKVILQ